MKNKLLPIIITSLFIIIFIFFYKGLQNSNIYTPETKINIKVPSFDAELFHEKKLINSSELFQVDKYYLLNIWSSWCVPCRQEHKFLMVLNEENKINLIGLNYKDNKKKAKKFLDELGNPYNKVFVDLDGTIAIEWGAYGVPESYLILNNKIVKKYIGPLNQKSIDEIKLFIK